MPGQLKEIRNRIKAFQNSQQITKAMKMVSAAKLRRAQEAIVQMRPYAKKLQEVLSNIVSNSEGEGGSNLAVERPIEKVLMIVITSDRTLCGAYNSNIIKLAKLTIKEKYSAQFAKGNLSVWAIGKKGYENFLKNNFKVSDAYVDIFTHLNFESVQTCAQAAVKALLISSVNSIGVKGLSLAKINASICGMISEISIAKFGLPMMDDRWRSSHRTTINEFYPCNAAAPLTISVNSVVIAACRARL